MKKFFKPFLNKYFLYTLAALVSVGVLVAVFFQSKDQFIEIWTKVNTKYLVLCGVCAVAIYFSMGMALWEILRVMGKKLSIPSTIAIALVSTTVNYLVSSFGVSGFALRAHLLGRRKVPLGVSVTASIVSSVIIYFVLAIIILMGSTLMFLSSSATQEQMLQNLLLIIGMGVVCFVITMFLFNNDFRITWVRKIFRLINRISYKLFSAIIPKYRFDNFRNQFETGITFIQKKKGRLTFPIIYICADWLFTMLILYFAFRAVGEYVSAGVLIAGFAVGMATTLIPILPGGIGAMELAMTAIFANSGIPWESALTACLIYRFSYYIMPGVFSIFVYWALQLSDSTSTMRKKLDKMKAGRRNQHEGKN
ncbi:TIRG00374 family protein [Elusimicrobium posterum]|uniref:lysylphosphatidylglycerol synthase transmembrane domain-containing protein n=1 Tax=Elusimicrobium posterum TaxID=3116653 RepID=UPI003C74F8D6